MQIEVVLPRESEASVEVLTKEGRVVIEPYFTSAVGNKTIAHVIVKGENGRQRTFNLSVYGKNGRIQATEFKKIETDFDRCKPGEEPTPEDTDAGEDK
jgi:hypothetical protein